MKNMFPGYFKLTEDERKKLWDKCIFALDANILLNMYRYSSSTRHDFFKILDGLKDRIWIPNQAALEYLENRLEVIGDQEKTYDKLINKLKNLKDIEGDLKNPDRHPFINPQLLNKICKVFSDVEKELTEELTKNKQEHTDRIKDDEIQDKLKDLLKGKVGPEYSKDELKSLIDRYL